jgi:hypothetical protein
MLRNLMRGACTSVAIAVAGTAFAADQGKWFVLRNQELGSCWTAVVIRIDGQYINTFERKAGGPYDTEEQALARLQVLNDQGTCNRD